MNSHCNIFFHALKGYIKVPSDYTICIYQLTKEYLCSYICIGIKRKEEEKDRMNAKVCH